MKTSDEVFDDLLDFFLELHRILDASSETSLQDFERRHRTFEAHHFASGVRHEAKCRLLEVADAYPCIIEDLPLNGLLVIHQNYAIRIRKADDGGLPPTNGSENLTQFYEQIPLPLITLNDGQPEELQTELNLVVIWETDETHHLAWVEVVCPIGEKEILWRRPVPHPATIVVAPPESVPPSLPDFEFEETEEPDTEADENVN